MALYMAYAWISYMRIVVVTYEIRGFIGKKQKYVRNNPTWFGTFRISSDSFDLFQNNQVFTTCSETNLCSLIPFYRSYALWCVWTSYRRSERSDVSWLRTPKPLWLPWNGWRKMNVCSRIQGNLSTCWESSKHIRFSNISKCPALWS